MRSHTRYLTFNTQSKREFVRITAEVAEAVRDSQVQEGLVLVSAMHITAAVFVNDDEPGLHGDIWEWLQHLAPVGPEYGHHCTGEDNGDAHLKSLLLHNQTILPVTCGRLDLGPWQEVLYAEFDGERRKRLVIKVIGD